MRTVHTIAALHLDDGGPTRSVSELAAALAALELDVHIVAGRDPEREVAVVDPRVRVHAVAAGHTTLLRRLSARGFAQAVLAAAETEEPVVLHTHGVWLRQSHDAIRAARKLGVPVVLSPRGMLEPWALAYRAWKKKLAWLLYQQRDLHAVSAFHATSEMEAENLRLLGLRQPIIVLPNGVNLPSALAAPPPAGPRHALFLSRIHVKKGLDLLVKAWAQVRPAGWTLTIAGNDDGGYARQLGELIVREGVADTVSFIGPAYGEAKVRLFRDASLFVLPSHSENFGIVVAEALGYGVPVITTHGTPWAELATEHCGWHVPVTPAAIADALGEATKLPAEALLTMGRAGRRLVEERYQWRAIAVRFAEAYRALAAGDLTALKALPFVRTD